MVILKQQIEQYRTINIKTTYPDWDTATTYNFGDILFYNHYYFRSVIDSNTGNIPVENSEYWIRWSVSNRYAQIDLRATTSTVWNTTTATDPTDNALISEFDNNAYDMLALGKVHGSAVIVDLFDYSDTLVFSETEIIYARPNSNNWYGYYFDPFLNEGFAQNFLFRLPVVVGGYVRVTIGKDGSDEASASYMVAGSEIYIGESLYGVSLGLEDNSLIEIDDFGVTTLIRRDANEFMDIDVMFPANQIQQIKRKTRDIFGTIVLFIGDESTSSNGYEHLPILGYVENYTTVLSNSVKISASYSIKEVI